MGIEDIILIDTHLFKQGKNLPKEVWVLVLEESYTRYDVSVCVTDHLTLQRWGELLQQSFLVLNRMKVLVVVLNEVPDPDLKLFRHGNLSGIVSECQQLLLEDSTFIVHASQNRGEVSDCERIKADSENHPDHTEDELCIS